jgi:hypothetical protein
MRFAGMMALLGLMALGCEQAAPEPVAQSAAEPAPVGGQFDPSTAGTIRGKVLWSGAVPEVAPFEVRSWVMEGSKGQPRPLRPNPHAPAIDPRSGGVLGAVVFLRTVDPKLSRPWERQLVVEQGRTRSRVGFVRRGDAVTLVSRETEFNALHASGAAFFTLTFPDREQPLKRQFRDNGIVELSSNAGYYWMRAHLFVDDHPYFTRTNAGGNFELCQVPPGKYQLVCWMPNWHMTRQDRDPESGLVTRIAFQAPVEQTCGIAVEPGQCARADFSVNAELFEAPPAGLRGDHAP